ncbi:MAG: methionine synthase I [Rhodospirillaceae bacterium]|nr:methionine synthase I [Rhodospirillaceae bacterium]|tara:strand:- start:349 stop:1377 length:1029 start_codon:yes stop_codon:yes gene_type:complete
MSKKLEKLLAENSWLLADGSTGTNLFAAGLQSGDSPELWNIEFPARISKLYRDSIDAGADIFLTNTFGGNASRLKLHGAHNKVFEINRVAAELARNVADQSTKEVVVAGSIGPTGEVFAPIGPLIHEQAVEIFHEQAEGLIAGGVDILWLETISASEEFKAAAEAFSLLGFSWCGTMSFDTAGRTMMGLTSVDMTLMIQSLPNKPIAFGANCGVGASDLLRTVLGFSSQDISIPIIAKGNAGIPKYVNGHIHYDGTPELMAKYASLARAAGAKIIGGCCGTTPLHLAVMRSELESQASGPRPSLQKIVDTLGEFSSASDGLEMTGGQNRQRNRKRVRRRAGV